MGHAAGKRHATSLASLLLVLCLSTHVSTTVAETWNDRPLDNRFRRGLDERSRSRRFQDQDRGLESRDQDTSQVIIEEPDDRNDDDGDDMLGDSGQGRVRRRGTKRVPDPSLYQDIVSPWEPPLFEWIYNPVLQRRNERYYKQQGGEIRGGDGAETNTNTDSARSQSLTSSTIRRSFPTNQNYPGRLKNYPRQTRPANRPPEPLTRSQQQSLSPQGHNVLPQPVGQISKLQPYSAIQGSYTARRPNPSPNGNVSHQTRGHISPALPSNPASFQGSSAARRPSPTSHNVAPAPSSQYSSPTAARGGLAARPVSEGDSLGSRVSFPDRNQLSQYRSTLTFGSASAGNSQGTVASGTLSSPRGFPAQSSSGLPQPLPPSPLVRPQAATRASSSPDAQPSRPPQGSDAVTSPQQHRSDVRTWPQAGDGKRSVLPEPQTRRVGDAHAGVTVGSRGTSFDADVTAATDESACRVQLTVCQSNERSLRALQNTYQGNLVRLKTLIADAVDRFIQDPAQPLDSAVCSPRRPDRPTFARATVTPDPTAGHSDVTRDGHSVVTDSGQDHRKPQVYGSSSYDDDDEDDVIVDVVEHDGGMSGRPGDDVGSAVQTVTGYPPANNNEVDDEDTVTMVHSGIIDLDNSRINLHHTVISQHADNDLDGREGRDPVNHLVSSSRQQNGDQRIANVPSHQQGQETTTRVQPTEDRREFELPSGEDDIILTDSGKTLLGQGQLGNRDEISRSGSGTGDGSGKGVHFDDLEDLDEAETERDRTQQRMSETWRQRNQHEREDRPQERHSQKNQQEKVGGCSLGDWTEWAGPVGFGVIERRRFVVDGNPECSQKAKDADLVMRVDIAVFNANHTYYKPTEEVGQDFETDFTRSYVPRDLLLVLDASGSIEAEDFELIRQGVAVMIDLFCGGFGMQPSNNRLAVIMFASDIKIIHRFSDDQSPNALRDVIANMTQPNGNTCTGDALKLAHDVIFTPENGSRPDVVHDTLLLTDGHSNCGEVTVQEGAQLLRSVSNIFALGVGIANDTEARWELNSVVSNNEPRHIFSLERYEDFKDMTRSIHERQKTVPCLPIVDSKPKQDN